MAADNKHLAVCLSYDGSVAPGENESDKFPGRRGYRNSCFSADEEAFPNSVDTFARNDRPALSELIKRNPTEQLDQIHALSSVDATSDLGKDLNAFEGFGWIKGVLIRCILCIIGATLYLRMSWIAGQAGIFLGMVVILLSLLVVVITSVSMSAIATNGEVKNGGCYYLISRSLGPEFGGSIGLILYIANMINGAMNCVGLAESMVGLLKEQGITLFDGGINDIRLFALTTCLILQLIIFVGTEFENKTQILLLITICVSVAAHTIGAFLPLSTTQISQGMTGFSMQTIWDNMWPDYRDNNSFITMFGVYFPAMTGIMAGANMSGDLKDASKSIPIGTMVSIVVTTCVYSATMLLSAFATVRDSNGIDPPMYDNFTGLYIPPSCKANFTCKYGLANDYNIPMTQSVYGPLIVAGIIASTLSSASGCMIGAPRILQALCQDELFPGVSIFGKGRGPTNEPFPAYILTFLLTCGVILIGDLNAIAEIITNFFLAAFAITNFACFDATASNSPGFRPGFKYYNKWLSLFGAVLCIVCMFVLSWIFSLLTFFIFSILYLYLKHAGKKVSWGSSAEANRYRVALMGLLKLSRTDEHVKNYRPQILVLTGNPASRQCLVDFAYCISDGKNLMICGHVVPYSSSVAATACVRKLNAKMTDWLREQQRKAFYCSVANKSLRNGVQGLLQTVGLGKMQPNILMMGFKQNWLKESIRVEEKKHVDEYLGVILDAFESDMSLCIFRNGTDKLDNSSSMRDVLDNLLLRLPDVTLSDAGSNLHDDFVRGVAVEKARPVSGTIPRKAIEHAQRINSKLQTSSSVLNLTQRAKSPEPIPIKNNSDVIYSGSSGNNLGKKFRVKIKDGEIDVWYLYDDGGLTLLMSHLISSNINSFLCNANLRIFVICSSTSNPNEIKINMEKMLTKLRISFKAVKVIVEEDTGLYRETTDEYNAFLEILNPVNGSKFVYCKLPTNKDYQVFDKIKMNEGEFEKVKNAHYYQYNSAISSLMGAVGKEIYEMKNRHDKRKMQKCVERIESRYSLKDIAKCLVVKPKKFVQTLKIKRNKLFRVRSFTIKKYKLFRRSLQGHVINKREIFNVRHVQYAPGMLDARRHYNSSTFEDIRDFFVNIKNVVANQTKKATPWAKVHSQIKAIDENIKNFRNKDNYRDKVLFMMTGKTIRRKPNKISQSLSEQYGLKEPMWLKMAHGLLDSVQASSNISFTKVLSPKFFSIYEKMDSERTDNILSPNLFPLYESERENKQDVLPVPTILKKLGFEPKNRDNLLELLMEVSGVSENVNMLMGKLEGTNESELEPEIDGFTNSFNEVFKTLRNTFSRRQRRELDQKKYTFMSRKQLEFMFGENGIYNMDTLPFDLDDYEKWTEVQKKMALINVLKKMAEVESSRRIRKSVILSPFSFSPTLRSHTLLAPIILSPSMFSPGLVGLITMSPPIMSPQLANPLIIS
uniref:Solute carrier family 12 member 1 n=1 Tax=Rhabditophanes sp. KR3021 TaxID=114890 RepID=A0AC35UCH6_9BILA